MTRPGPSLRRQALGWLKAELAAWSRIVESGTPQDRTRVAAILLHWRKDADLTAISDTDALSKLARGGAEGLAGFLGRI